MSTTSNNFDQIRLVSLSTPFGLSRFFSIFVFEKIIEINYIIKISLEMHFSIPETREVKNGFKTFIVSIDFLLLVSFFELILIALVLLGL